jgi:hypothetical protein
MKKGKKNLTALRKICPDLEAKRRKQLLAESKRKRRAEDYPNRARDFLDLFEMGKRTMADFAALPKCIRAAANKLRAAASLAPLDNTK